MESHTGTVEWIVLASVGVLIGLGLGFFLGRLGGKGSSQKLADVEAELEEYRQEVSEHFSRQYRELYEHMAAGSEKLCVGAPSEGQLKFPRPDEVTAEEVVDTKPGDSDVKADEDSAARDASKSDADTTADKSQTDEETVDSSAEDSDESRKAAADLEAATAPVDYADEDSKDRRYH